MTDREKINKIIDKIEYLEIEARGDDRRYNSAMRDTIRSIGEIVGIDFNELDDRYYKKHGIGKYGGWL